MAAAGRSNDDAGRARRRSARKASISSHPTQARADEGPRTPSGVLNGKAADGVGVTKQQRNKGALRTRILSGAAFVVLFSVIIYLGHIACLILLLCLQHLITKELFDLARATARVPMNVSQERQELPGFRLQQWYIFFVACFYMYGKLLRDILFNEISSKAFQQGPMKYVEKVLWLILERHSLVTYLLYLFAFVMSVLSLKKGKYLYQFGQFAWTITIVLFVLVQTSFFIGNIFEGLIWFVLPCALVITNDIMAFVFGKLFGQTPLISLSPKKTWEGFIGGGFATILISIPLSSFLSRFDWLTCSRTTFSLYATSLECRNAHLQEPTTFHVLDFVPSLLLNLLGDPTWPGALFGNLVFTVQPIVVHGFFLAVFASLIAPFGGFFASGVKRALKIKDFGQSIPGHGGLTDRMDCQCVMGLFAYVYLSNFVKGPSVSASKILEKVSSIQGPLGFV